MCFTLYLTQLELLKSTVTSLSSEVIDWSRIEFRTVDSCLSVEVDIVICDNPRSFGEGFTMDCRRLNVTHTRAKMAEFVIVSCELIKPKTGFYRESALESLYK